MQYDFKLDPYEAKQYEVFGRFVKYVQGSAAIRVTLSAGGYVDLLPGQGVWGMEFQNFVIEDRSGTENKGVLMAGSFDFRDDRITGSVEVIDGARNRTLANQAFLGTTYLQAAAGQYPAIMLWNPVDSGKRVVVERVRRSANLSGNLGIVIRNAPCATLDKKVQSKLSGGATSTAEFRFESKANINGNALASESWVAGSQEKERAWLVPVVLLPGYGLELWCGTAQSDIQGSFEFTEEPILA